MSLILIRSQRQQIKILKKNVETAKPLVKQLLFFIIVEYLQKQAEATKKP